MIHWNTTASGVGTNLTDIQFVTNNIGWIVGYNGQIYKTINGGANWTIQASNTNANLWSVHFIDANVGFATGVGIILKTTDGGINWTISYQSESTENVQSFKSIYFTDTENGWVVGQESITTDGVIFHTSNGGINWLKQNSGVTGFRLQSVHFIDAMNGWACGGDGTVLSTIDGGSNWSIETTNLDPEIFLRDIYAIGLDKVYAVGEIGTIITNYKFFYLSGNLDDNVICEVGSSLRLEWESFGIENLRIEYTSNAGKNWILIESNYPTHTSYYDWLIPNTPSIFCRIRIINALDDSLLNIIPYPVSYAQKYIVIHGENKWEKVAIPTQSKLMDIKFLNHYDGISWSNSVLLVTDDGGLTWSKKSEFSSRSASFINPNMGWAVINEGDSSHVLKTIDGGLSWQKQFNLFREEQSDEYSQHNEYISDIKFIDNDNGWFAFNEIQEYWTYLGDILYFYGKDRVGNLYKTNDGGNNWEIYGSPSEEIYSLEFISKENGWFFAEPSYYDDTHDGATPHHDMQYHSINNGGFSWDNTPDHTYPVPDYYSTPTTDDLDIFFIETGYGWLSQKQSYDNYKLYKYDTSWEKLYEAANFRITSIFFATDDIGWFFGGFYDSERTENFICRTVDGGINWELQQFDIPDNLKIINFFSIDGQLCWAVGDNGTIMRIGNLPPPQLKVYATIKTFLQGPYLGNQIMSISLALPLQQPFNIAPWNYDGYESFATIPDDVVDWVLLELRDKTNSSLVKTTRAAFILKNGNIVDLDGINPVEFIANEDEYYIVVKHRNHLSVMSANSISIEGL